MITRAKRRRIDGPAAPQAIVDGFKDPRARFFTEQAAAMTRAFVEYLGEKVDLFSKARDALFKQLDETSQDLLDEADVAERLKELQPPLQGVEEFLRLRELLVREMSAFVKEAAAILGLPEEEIKKFSEDELVI